MKDLLLCVDVVVKTSNLKISRSLWLTSTAPNNSTKVRAALVARLFFLVHPIRSLFSGVVVAVAVVLA